MIDTNHAASLTLNDCSIDTNLAGLLTLTPKALWFVSLELGDTFEMTWAKTNGRKQDG